MQNKPHAHAKEKSKKESDKLVTRVNFALSDVLHSFVLKQNLAEQCILNRRIIRALWSHNEQQEISSLLCIFYFYS